MRYCSQEKHLRTSRLAYCTLIAVVLQEIKLKFFISYRHVAALKNRLFGLVFFIDACIQSAKTACVIKQSSLTAVSTSVKRLPRQSRGSDSRCVLNSSHRLLIGFLKRQEVGMASPVVSSEAAPLIAAPPTSN